MASLPLTELSLSQESLSSEVFLRGRSHPQEKFLVWRKNCLIKFPYTAEEITKLSERHLLLRKSEPAHLLFPDLLMPLTSADTSNSFGLVYSSLVFVPREAEFYEEPFGNRLSYRVISKFREVINLNNYLLENYLQKQEQIDWVLRQATSVTCDLIKLTGLQAGIRNFSTIFVQEEEHKVFILDVDESTASIPSGDCFYLTSILQGYKQLWTSFLDRGYIRKQLSLVSSSSFRDLFDKLISQPKFASVYSFDFLEKILREMNKSLAEEDLVSSLHRGFDLYRQKNSKMLAISRLWSLLKEVTNSLDNNRRQEREEILLFYEETETYHRSAAQLAAVIHFLTLKKEEAHCSLSILVQSWTNSPSLLALETGDYD